jgi:hypothetical protein
MGTSVSPWPQVPDAPNLLPRPQHVVLNHHYSDKSKMLRGVHVGWCRLTL